MFQNTKNLFSGAPYILENLIPEETYDFQFAARNDVGLGGFINIESITMPRRSVPAEPKFLIEGHTFRDENNSNREDMVVLSPYADHFELRWSVPHDNGDPIMHYLIRYCQVGFKLLCNQLQQIARNTSVDKAKLFL